MLNRFNPHKNKLRFSNLILLGLLLLAFSVNAQEYKQWMNSSEVKVTDIIAAAEAYLAENPSRKERKHFERWKYNALRQQDENGYLRKRATVTNALRQFIAEKEVLARQKNVTANWQEVGPTNWNATEGYTPGVGRITSFAQHPTDPNTFIIGADTGGVWKTTDGGATWSVLTDNFTNMKVDALAIDPSAPNTYYWGSTEGRVYKSTDAGSTWTALGTTDDFGDVNKIIIDPNNSNKVLVTSSNSGVFLSDDGGVNFYLEIDNSVEPDGYDIEFKPDDPTVVYAAGQKFHKSTDGGDTYTTNTTDFDFSDKPKMIGVSPANPNRVYVVESDGSGFNAFYISNDAGDSFTKLSHTLNYFGYNQDGSDDSPDEKGQAPRDMGIAVSPTNADEVHIAGINTWRSTDGGTTFSPTSAWFYNGSDSYCHADVDDVVFKGNTLVALTDGGIYFAENSTAAPSPTFYTDKSTGMGIHQFYKIGVSQTSTGTVTGGAQDNGNSFFDGTAWKNWLGADGMEGFVDKNNSNILYGEQQNGSQFKSLDGGLTNVFIEPPTQENGEWVTPFEQDPITPNTIYSGYKQVFKSADGGDSWTAISQDFGGNLNNLKIAPSDNTIMFASKAGELYRTTTGSGTWDILSGFSGDHISSIAIHPTDPNKVAIATNGADKVYISTDGGDTWVGNNAGLPNFSALCLVWQNSANNCLYLGMDYGVFYIKDGLTDWVNYSNQLPNVIVNELEINYAEDKLYAGTYGRGVWKSDLHEASNSALAIELGDFSAELIGEKVNLSWFTLSEVENDYFMVQKSLDGVTWSGFEQVNAVGNSAKKMNYATTDSKPAAGVNYYRLVNVDLAGEKQYSQVIAVNLAGVDLLNIYPNPSHGQFVLQTNAQQNSILDILIFDVAGKLVHSKSIKTETGGMEIPVQVDEPAGVYFMTLKVDGVSVYRNKRLIIQE